MRDSDHGTRREQLLNGISNIPYDEPARKLTNTLSYLMSWAEAHMDEDRGYDETLTNLRANIPAEWLQPLTTPHLFGEAWKLPYEQALPVMREIYEAQKAQMAAIFGELEFSMLATAVVSKDDPSKVAYLPSADAPKYRRTSWSKYLLHLKGKGIAFPDSLLQQAQALLSTAFSLEKWTHEIFYGDDLLDVYDNGRFSRSCMTGGHGGPILYAENPDKVGVVAVYQNGDPYGRALLWTTDDGTKFLDRVYPSDGNSHFAYLERVAAAEGWEMRVGPRGVGGTANKPLRITLKDVDHYPYMDTFSEVIKTPLQTGDGTFVLGPYQEGERKYSMTSTEDRCPWGNQHTRMLMDGSTIYEDDFDENDDIGYDEDADDYDWRENFVSVLNGDWTDYSENNPRVRHVNFHRTLSTPDSEYVLVTDNTVHRSLIEAGSDYRVIQYGPMRPLLTDRWMYADPDDQDEDEIFFTCDCRYCVEANRAHAAEMGIDFDRSLVAGEAVRLDVETEDEGEGKESTPFVLPEPGDELAVTGF